VDSKTLGTLNKAVRKSFPEMARVRPKVSQQGKNEDNLTYLLTYSGSAELPGGRKIKRIVRVVADERGRILKMTTSR